MRKLNMIDGVYGRLTVLRPAENRQSRAAYHCRCACGAEIVAKGELLRNGTTKSCGCLRRELGQEMGKKTSLRHGEGSNGKESAEYRTWTAMKSRCANPNHCNYPHYGARGIRVCERWQGYENFLADMGRRPSDGHSLDRIDSNGNYEPGNCRWATRMEQSGNQRHNGGRRPMLLTILRNTKTLAEWLSDAGLAYVTYWRRTKSGELPEDVILDAILAKV